MFKKLRDRVAEEVRQSNLNVNLGQFFGQQDEPNDLPNAACGSLRRPSSRSQASTVSGEGSSLMEPMPPADLPSRPPSSDDAGHRSASASSVAALVENWASANLSRQRSMSTSSQSSEPAVLQVCANTVESSSRFTLPSDTESEAETAVVTDLSRVTKEEIYAVLQRCKQKAERYKTKYFEAVRAYKQVSDEKNRIAKILTDSQDKALRRINELREQADLEQKAKAHLEENLRVMIDEKDEKIKVMQTKIDLLSNNEDLLKPFKDQVRELKMALQSKTADAIVADERRRRTEDELSKITCALNKYNQMIVEKDSELTRLRAQAQSLTPRENLSNQGDIVAQLRLTLEAKEKELQEISAKYAGLEDKLVRASATAGSGSVTNAIDSKAVSAVAEHWEAKMRASEKKLSQKENELRKIARTMHQLKLMVITEEDEEVAADYENNQGQIGKSDQSSIVNGEEISLAKKIEGSVEQLLSDKLQLQRSIDELRSLCATQSDELEALRARAERAERALSSNTERKPFVASSSSCQKSPSVPLVSTDIGQRSGNEPDIILNAGVDTKTRQKSASSKNAGSSESFCTVNFYGLACDEGVPTILSSGKALHACEENRQSVSLGDGDVFSEAAFLQEIENLASCCQKLCTKIELDLRAVSQAANYRSSPCLSSVLSNVKGDAEHSEDHAAAFPAKAACEPTKHLRTLLFIKKNLSKLEGYFNELFEGRYHLRESDGRSLDDSKPPSSGNANETTLQGLDINLEFRPAVDSASQKHLELPQQRLKLGTLQNKACNLNKNLADALCTDGEALGEAATISEQRLKICQSDLDVARQEIESLKSALDSKTAEFIRLVDELLVHESHQKEAESRISKLESHYGEWIRSLEMKQVETDEALRRCEKERDIISENASRLERANLVLEGRLKQVEQDGKLKAADLEAKLIVEKDRFAKVDHARKSLDDQRSILETKISVLQQRIQVLEDDKSLIKAELLEKRAECESWEESMKTGDERTTRLRQLLKDATATIDQLQADIQGKEERTRAEFALQIEDLEKANVVLKGREDQLNIQLQTAQKELDRTNVRFKQLVESPVHQENLQLRVSLKTSEEERERLLREATRYKEELERVERQSELLSAETKALRDCNTGEVDSLREQMDEYKNQATLAQECCDKQQLEIESLRKRLLELVATSNNNNTKDNSINDDGWENGLWGDEGEWVQSVTVAEPTTDGPYVENEAQQCTALRQRCGDLLKDEVLSHSTDRNSPAAVLEVNVEEGLPPPGLLLRSTPYETCESVDSLRMQLAKQQDEVRDLKALLGLHAHDGLAPDLPGPTEYEYLKNIMFNFMMGRETQTLCKVIAAVLRFSGEQTRLVTERHESLYKAHHQHYPTASLGAAISLTRRNQSGSSSEHHGPKALPRHVAAIRGSARVNSTPSS